MKINSLEEYRNLTKNTKPIKFKTNGTLKRGYLVRNNKNIHFVSCINGYCNTKVFESVKLMKGVK